MAYRQIAVTREGVVVEDDLGKAEIKPSDLSSLSTAGQVKTALDLVANRELSNLFVHVNRDGSLAIATGREPDVWPEDAPEGMREAPQ